MDIKAEAVLKNIRKEVQKIRDKNRKLKNHPYAENTMVMVGLLRSIEIVQELRDQEMEKLIDWNKDKNELVSN